MLVDGHRIAHTGLRDGSEVKIGNTTMTVRIVEERRGRARMSELTLFLIRVAYLAILWIFVLSAISVIRSDMFGARVPEAARGGGRAARRRSRPSSRSPASAAAPRPTCSSSRATTPASAPSSPHAPILIGRGSDAAIRLDDDYVSTRHARIAASGDQWFVEDLGSTNGTYVGTVRITQPTTITLGTQVRIGKTILELRK